LEALGIEELVSLTNEKFQNVSQNSGKEELKAKENLTLLRIWNP